MKATTRLLCASLLAVCLLSGCATTGSGPQREALYGTITTGLAVAVLKENPDYEPALHALSTGIDVVLDRGAVTPEQIAAFVEGLAVKHKLSPESKLLIALGIDELIRLYQARTGDTDLDLTKPEAAAALRAFKAGLLRGIAYHRLLQPNS